MIIYSHDNPVIILEFSKQITNVTFDLQQEFVDIFSSLVQNYLQDTSFGQIVLLIVFQAPSFRSFTHWNIPPSKFIDHDALIHCRTSMTHSTSTWFLASNADIRDLDPLTFRRFHDPRLNVGSTVVDRVGVRGWQQVLGRSWGHNMTVSIILHNYTVIKLISVRFRYIWTVEFNPLTQFQPHAPNTGNNKWVPYIIRYTWEFSALYFYFQCIIMLLVYTISLS